jgi:branched-chain amino acid transport system substrate-binding protein
MNDYSPMTSLVGRDCVKWSRLSSRAESTEAPSRHQERCIVFSAIIVTLFAVLVLSSTGAAAQKSYGPGVTDSEIKIGQTMPYSGPLSMLSGIGRAHAAYFAKVNAEGGVKGRQVNLMSFDDGYAPPKTVEQTRRLIEQEQVLLIFGSLGVAPNSAIQKYLNAKQIPQLFITASGTKWSDPRAFPWTIALPPDERVDLSAQVDYLLKTKPNARIAVLYQNDDYGKEYAKELSTLLGDRAARMIVARESYETTGATVDSQIIALHAAGADTLFSFAAGKFAANAVRKVYDMGWKPLHFLAYPASAVSSVLQPAGLEKSIGVLSTAFLKDPHDPQWRDDRDTRQYLNWMKQYYPAGDPMDRYNVYGYVSARLLVHVLQQCGDELTRDNVLRHAANLKNVEVPMLLPGVRYSTSPSDYTPLKTTQIRRFDGKHWAKIDEAVADRDDR